MRSGLWAVVAAAVVLLAASSAAAEVQRFAVLVGHNRGEPDEADLRYAEADASKMRDVLVDLGGFAPENVVLLRGKDASAVRRAVISTNDRVRAAGSDALLFVYYSGHADARSLHLGGSELSLDELEKLVRGSAAGVRLLVLDACRSGALTRVKGGRRAPAFRIDVDERLESEGAIFLTSSSASEDAQESERLRGSFFTHFLVSGLLGAADDNGDAKVSLGEAYRYAYENTLRASSRTLAGTQHPTFRYDISGRGDVVLAHLDLARSGRAVLRVPPGRAYLVFEGDEDGRVAVEIGARDRRRAVSLRPGRYFVRGRGRASLLEGTVSLGAGEELTVRDDDLERIDYARLVRKGGVLDRAHAVVAGARGHTAMDNAERACVGGFAGYELATRSVEISARLGWCRAGFDGDVVTATVDELDLALRLALPYDLRALSVGPYLSAGPALLVQRFETRGEAPSRATLAAGVGLGIEGRVALPRGLFAGVDASARSYWFRGDRGLEASAGLELAVGLGWRWP